MYKSTREEYEQCIEVVQEILTNTEDYKSDDIIGFAEEVLRISYSIGGGYDKEVIKKIAKTLLEKS